MGLVRGVLLWSPSVLLPTAVPRPQSLSAIPFLCQGAGSRKTLLSECAVVECHSLPNHCHCHVNLRVLFPRILACSFQNPCNETRYLNVLCRECESWSNRNHCSSLSGPCAGMPCPTGVPSFCLKDSSCDLWSFGLVESCE